MKHTESTDNAVFWAAPVLLGLLMTFGGLLAGACLLSAGTIGLQMKPLAVCLPFAAGTMLTAGWSARRAPANRFVLGFLTGLSLLGCLFLLSLTLRDAAVQAAAAGMISGTAIASALTGAILGAAAKTKKRRR
ncbi:MAG: hypothetical protein UDP13_03720 [Butyricicoccus sp.]|nr:hypothetical protein [Butyricicoccus sp.]